WRLYATQCSPSSRKSRSVRNHAPECRQRVSNRGADAWGAVTWVTGGRYLLGGHSCLEWGRYHCQRLVRNFVFVDVEFRADPTFVPCAFYAVDDLASLNFVSPVVSVHGFEQGNTLGIGWLGCLRL